MQLIGNFKKHSCDQIESFVGVRLRLRVLIMSPSSLNDYFIITKAYN